MWSARKIHAWVQRKELDKLYEEKAAMATLANFGKTDEEIKDEIGRATRSWNLMLDCAVEEKETDLQQAIDYAISIIEMEGPADELDKSGKRVLELSTRPIRNLDERLPDHGPYR